MLIDHYNCQVIPKTDTTSLLEITDTQALQSYYLEISHGQSLDDALKAPKGDRYITAIWNQCSEQQKDQLRQLLRQSP